MKERKQTDAKGVERTLIIIKPDGMLRAKQILKYYEKAGLRIIAKKEVRIDKNFAVRHYAATDDQVIGMGNKTIEASRNAGKLGHMKKIFGTDDAKKIGEKLRAWLIEFITSRPVLALVLEGEDAVALSRKVTGFTDPAKADKGTVRGDMGTDSIVKANNDGRPVMNLVHASGNAEEAKREIALWFPELKK
jgi:nucleoside-diphosphate kinase